MSVNPEIFGRNACRCGYDVKDMIPEKTVMIEKIVKTEWSMFSSVKDASGITYCQQDPQTFCLMRVSQASIWQDDTLASYLNDLKNAGLFGVNLMTEKYARMMESTHPVEYEQIKNRLPTLTPVLIQIVDQILAYFSKWDEEVARRYPKFRLLGRKGQDNFNNTTTVTYLRAELLTYSATTLNLCLRDAKNASDNQINLAEKILEGTAQFYGYSSLSELEHKLP